MQSVGERLTAYSMLSGAGVCVEGRGASGDEASQVRGGYNMYFFEELGSRGQSPQRHRDDNIRVEVCLCRSGDSPFL